MRVIGCSAASASLFSPATLVTLRPDTIVDLLMKRLPWRLRSGTSLTAIPPRRPLSTLPPSTSPPSPHLPSISSSSDPSPFYTLGLDVNTQTIGYVLLSPSLHVLTSGLISPPPHLPPPLRLSHFRSLLTPLLTLPSTLPILPATESYLRSFQASRFHLASLFTLAEWNTLVCYAVWEMTGVWPERLHVNKARGMWGLKKGVDERGEGGEGKGKDVKRVVWEWVEERVRKEREEGKGAGIEWVRKANGDVHSSQFDISDAYIIALSAATQRLHSQQAASAVSAGGERGAGEEQPVKAKRTRKARAKEAPSLTQAMAEVAGSPHRVRRKAVKADLLLASPTSH